MPKTKPTPIILRTFIRNYTKYLGGRYNVIGRHGEIIAQIYPPFFIETEGGFTSEDRANLEGLYNELEKIPDKILDQFNP